MTAKALADSLGFDTVCCPNPDAPVKGSYVGDLLSWVMGRANEGDAWITIMTNINIVAVASLTGTSCIILAEGTSVDEKTKATAEEKGINIFSTPLSAYKTAAKLSGIIGS